MNSIKGVLFVQSPVSNAVSLRYAPPSYLGLAARDRRGGASFAPPQYQHALESTDHAIPTYRNQLEVSLLDLRISSSFLLNRIGSLKLPTNLLVLPAWGSLRSDQPTD
jgi:hypothetical protein